MSEHVIAKKSILKKTIQVGSNTLVSRILGLAREILLMRFLGVGIIADAFTTAFMLPNSLRKIFAEGALTAAFVPTLVAVQKKEGKTQVDKLTTLSFVVFEVGLLLICALIMVKARWTVLLIAPGYSAEQVAATIPLLRIMMPFIFFISSSALLAGVLNIEHHFFVPAFGPVLLNGVFIGSILVCLKYGLGAQYLAWSILLGGALQCIMHIIAYIRLGFSFSLWNTTTMVYFMQVVGKFLLCFMSMSVMEINLFFDQRFASYLAAGSVKLINLANRFMGIPLGVFAVAFSTILLPYFARVKLDNPDRLAFYLFEGTKFVLWVTIPATFILAFLSDQIFLTLFASVSNNFPMDRVTEAGFVLVGFLLGLCFFSLNKILLSLFYSFHDTKYPTIISVIATLFNIAGNYFLVDIWGSFGLAVATSLSGLLQTILCFYFLQTQHNLSLKNSELLLFCRNYGAQVIAVLIPLYGIYSFCFKTIAKTAYGTFFTQSFGFWVWALPLILLCYGALYLLKKQFELPVYFLE